MLDENLAVLDVELLQRLKAIGREAGRDDGERLRTGLGQRLHRLVGIGLEPFGRAEARLEGQPEALGRQIELLAQQPPGFAQWQ